MRNPCSDLKKRPHSEQCGVCSSACDGSRSPRPPWSRARETCPDHAMRAMAGRALRMYPFHWVG
eukprot:6470140-Alexandrium_andersonii.AAC.1